MKRFAWAALGYTSMTAMMFVMAWCLMQVQP